MKHVALACATALSALTLMAACDESVIPPEDLEGGTPALEWRFDNPPYHSLYDISGSWPDAMVAVGPDGTVLRLVDGEWAQMESTPLSGLSYGVWSLDASEFFAVDYARDYSAARVHRYQSGEWTTWNLDGLCRPMDIWGMTSTDVYVVTRCRGGIYHFDGQEWSQVSDWLGFNIEGRSSSDVYVVGYDGLIHYDGTGWTPVTLPDTAADMDFWDVWAAPSGDVWLIGDAVLRFDGSSWTVVDVGADPVTYFGAVWGSGADVFVSEDACAAYPCTHAILHYDGATWTSTDVPHAVWGISGTGPDDVWAVGNAGRIYQYDGTGWTTVRGGFSNRLYAVRGTTGGPVYAAGSRTVLRHDGLDWDEVLSSAELSTNPRAIWLDGPDDVFVVGGGDEPILHYDGVSWTPMASPVGGLSGVWGASPTDVFAVGADGVVRYDGAAWTGMSVGTARPMRDVWGASPTDVIAVGDYDPRGPDQPGIMHFDGQSWEGAVISHMSHALEAVWGTGPEDVFAVGQGGLILHWDGATWQEQDSGTSADLKAVWGDAPSDVYAVGEAGTVVHYDGSVWTPLRFSFGLGSTLHDVWLEDGSDVVVVGDAGTILRGIR